MWICCLLNAIFGLIGVLGACVSFSYPKEGSTISCCSFYSSLSSIAKFVLVIIGTVWSPPGWMKVNGEITGGKRTKNQAFKAVAIRKKTANHATV